MKIQASLSRIVVELRKSLGFNQIELGQRLGTSAMNISRWERGKMRPPADTLIKLGVLAQKDKNACWDFWAHAGLNPEDVVKVLPNAPGPWPKVLAPIIQIVKAGAHDKLAADSMVAIPLVPLVASAGKEKGSPHVGLRYTRFQQAIVAPTLWCPNPDHTICMGVRGNSMTPVLHDGYLIVVDQRQNNRKKLNGSIVVVRHDKFGLVVTRFWRLNNSEVLLPDNRSHNPVPWTAAWRVVGKVLWWIGQPAVEKPISPQTI
jgi:hypothetical protein